MKTEEKICAFSGHRIIPVAERPVLCEQLKQLIRAMYLKKGIRTFMAGGALGFDMLAEMMVMNVRNEFPDIRLILAVPCADQDAKWRERDRLLYREILENVDRVDVLHERYCNGCMQERNRYMVDRAAVLVAYLTHPSGGTAYTVRYAQSKGVPVINLR